MLTKASRILSVHDFFIVCIIENHQPFAKVGALKSFLHELEDIGFWTFGPWNAELSCSLAIGIFETVNRSGIYAKD